MKEKVNQMLKDKLFLVMLVLGLLTMVAAAGIMTVQKREKTVPMTPCSIWQRRKIRYRGSAADGGRQ